MSPCKWALASLICFMMIEWGKGSWIHLFFGGKSALNTTEQVLLLMLMGLCLQKRNCFQPSRPTFFVKKKKFPSVVSLRFWIVNTETDWNPPWSQHVPRKRSSKSWLKWIMGSRSKSSFGNHSTLIDGFKWQKNCLGLERNIIQGHLSQMKSYTYNSTNIIYNNPNTSIKKQKKRIKFITSIFPWKSTASTN